MNTYEQLRLIARDARRLQDELGRVAPALSDTLKIDTSIMDETVIELAQVARAATALENDVPLADSFPNGTPAPRIPTPRQVLYLVKVADTRPITAEERQDRAARGDSPPPRACEGKEGCRAMSLRWTPRAVCSAHSTEAERGFNNDMRTIYLEALSQV